MRPAQSPGTNGSGFVKSGSTCSSQASRVPNTLVHLYVNDIDAVSKEFGIPVEEEGLAGRECDLEDPDGNRLPVATRRS